MRSITQTLERYTTATLIASVAPRPPPPRDWRDLMEELSQTSCTHYKSYVYEHPKFVEYFRAATPLGELSQMNIGSRPARRNQTGGVDTLRAIPYGSDTRVALAAAPAPPPSLTLWCKGDVRRVTGVGRGTGQMGVCMDAVPLAPSGVAWRGTFDSSGHCAGQTGASRLGCRPFLYFPHRAGVPPPPARSGSRSLTLPARECVGAWVLQQPLLQEMYRDWPFFRSTIDLIQMVLAKADPRIVEFYDKQLVPESLWSGAVLLPKHHRARARRLRAHMLTTRRRLTGPWVVGAASRSFGEELRNELNECIRGILLVTCENRMLENDPVVRRAVEARLPFCDTLNILQVLVLKRLRSNDADAFLTDTLAVSIQGIVAAMGNSG